jgi:5-methylcytosine-specific restriction protein A
MAKLSTLRTRIILNDYVQRIRVATFTDTPRIRGTTLQNIRAREFERNPLCVMCLAATPPRTRVWTQLDHIIPLHQGGTDTPINRQGLCDECHLEKTNDEMGITTRKPGGSEKPF